MHGKVTDQLTALTQRTETINAVYERTEGIEEIVSEPLEDSISDDDTLRYSIGVKGKHYDIDNWLDHHSSDPSVRVSSYVLIVFI